jgi:hypothetical protein
MTTTLKPVKTCRSCGFTLDLELFGQGAIPSDYCDVCRDERAEARAWSQEDVALLLATARPIFDFWTRYFEVWTDTDLVDWRNFLHAVAREGLPTTIKPTTQTPLLTAARQRIDANIARFFAIREKWSA